MSEATDYKQTILLIDPDLDFLEWATKHLEAPGIRILRTDDAAKALKVLEKTDVDLVISATTLGTQNGLDLLKKMRSIDRELIVVLVSAFPSNTLVIEATQNGAHDIIPREALTFDLRRVSEEALATAEGRKAANKEPEEQAPLVPVADGKVRIVGQSQALQNVFKVVGRVARTDAPVLVLGESGTGKELISTAVHHYSPRCKNELVAINCGAIPENLLESELFGHEKGSFTGAMQRRIGRFEQCDGGTLFLDEIGEMPHHVQVRLLRILQTGEFSRVGGNETLKCDTRIVAATNKDLVAEVQAGNFREDLYYRLNVVEINLPSLRERREDIPLLAEYFLDRIARKTGSARLHLSADALEMLSTYSWPGNVRELENTMTRACALASSHVLLPEDIPLSASFKTGGDALENAARTLYKAGVEEGGNVITFAAKLILQQALDENGQDFADAAEALGCSSKELRKAAGLTKEEKATT